MKRRSIYRKLAMTTVVLVAACNARLLIDDGTSSEPWTGNAPDCPTSVPVEESACGVAEGQVCSFRVNEPMTGDYYDRLCGCWEAGASDLKWHCYNGTSAPWQCPTAEPSGVDSCYGLYGAECLYPDRTLCTCSSESGYWRCEDTGRDDLVGPPPGVPDDEPIDTLSNEQRAAWCDWYATAGNPGFPEPASSVVDADGYVVNNGCTSSGVDAFPCNVWMPLLSSAECEGNLALSTCAAPLSELTDCVLTVHDICWPSPHGCARYLERPGCDGTIVLSKTDRPATHPTGGTGPSGTGGTGPAGSGGATGSGTSPMRPFCSVRVRE